MPARQRWTASLYLIGAALSFCARLVDAALAALHRRYGCVLHTREDDGPKGVGWHLCICACGQSADHPHPHLPEERVRKNTYFLFSSREPRLLGLLQIFQFFCRQCRRLAPSDGHKPDQPAAGVVLPVGISFYTFQSLSYTIDVYRRRITPTSRFWDFALFVAYFPPMVAGPIERAVAPTAPAHKATPHPSWSVDGWHRSNPLGSVQEGRHRRRCRSSGRRGI